MQSKGLSRVFSNTTVQKHQFFGAQLSSQSRRDKKAFLSDQCKEIEENNTMGKTRDLFKKIRDTKGTFHAKMGSMTNLDSILKSRDITLPTKVHLVRAMVFLVVMYGCESWTIKKAESQRIDVFELWC